MKNTCPIPSPSVIQQDFDRIARLTADRWDHNSHYHGFLLEYVPAHCAAALDIGCGTGAFSRLLAQRCEQVLALDLSPEMIRLAKERSLGFPNIDYQVADATGWEFPVENFDFIACIATLHHLPIEQTLLKIKGSLRTAGLLAILDLFQSQSLSDLLTDVAAVPVNLALSLIYTGRLREPREVRAAWTAHGRNDSYPTLTQVRQICAIVLPGAHVRRHLLWRYSIIWQKVGA